MCTSSNLPQQQTSPPTILIVGGGPAGLAMAAHLLDNGVQCRVLERRSRESLLADTNSFYDMASSGIQALLRIANGVAAQPIFDSAVAYDKCALYTGQNPKSPLVNLEWKSRSLGMPMFNITRASLLKSLCETVEKFDKDCIVFETNARLLDEEEGTVEVEGPAWGTSKQILRADLVVAADGVHSRIRKHVFGEGHGLRSDGIVACYAVLPPLSPQEAKDFPKPQGLGNSYGIMGMSADFVQYAVVNPTATIWYANFILDGKPHQKLPDVPPGFDGWLDVSRDRCKGGIPAIEALINRTKEEDMQVVMCCDREPLDSYHKGRAVLVGDAAHPFTPYAGLGSSQAMVDAFCLAEALLQHGDNVDSAVAQYEAQRVKTANALMDESRNLCSTSLSWRFQFKIFEYIFWVGKMFGFHEQVADGVMTIDGQSLVNETIPIQDEEQQKAYEVRYQRALASLQAQV